MSPKNTSSSVTKANGSTESPVAVANRNRKRSRSEWAICFMVACPVLLLIGCFVVDAFAAASARSNLRAYVAQQVELGNPIDRVSLARQYENRSSKQHTAKWVMFADAASFFGDDPSRGTGWRGKRDLVDPANADDPMARLGKPSLPVVDFLVQRESPMVRARREVLGHRPGTEKNSDGEADEEKLVWMPMDFTDVYPLSLAQSVESTFWYQDLRAFQSAIGHKRNDQALKILHRMTETTQRLEPRFYGVYGAKSDGLSEDVISLVRQSLAVTDWDSDQLQQLRQMIQSVPDYEGARQLRRQYLTAISLDALGVSDGSSEKAFLDRRDYTTPAQISDRAVWGWIQFLEKDRQLASENLFANLPAQREVYWQDRPQTISLSSFPYANGERLIRQAGIYANRYPTYLAAYETRRRWTLTAIAIKQYRLQNDAWPAKLPDLREVGLTESDWEFVPGVEFAYELHPFVGSQNEVLLWTPDLESHFPWPEIERFIEMQKEPNRRAANLDPSDELPSTHFAVIRDVAD